MRFKVRYIVALPPWGEERVIKKEQLKTHSEGNCNGEFCVIHNPSNHHMVEWDQVWRFDRGTKPLLIERVCEHGTGHPDPDCMSYINDLLGPNNYIGVHGCDGCC